MRTLRGFTLVEMMLTVSVLGILIAIAAPSFTDMIEQNQMTTTANDLLASLLVARSEAIKRDTPIKVRKWNNSGGWSKGWKVRIQGVSGTAGELLRHFTTHSDITIVAQGTVGSLRYLANGRGVRNNSNASLRPTTDYFEISMGNQELECITFMSTGRPSVGDCP